MKEFYLRFIFFIVLSAFQIACGHLQTASDNDLNNSNSEFTNNNLNSLRETEKNKKEIDYFVNLEPLHKKILQEWLKSKPSLRPAVEEVDTSLDKSELEDIHKKGQTQFYTVADINRDGKEDFAILLINKKNSQIFALAIFNGNLIEGKLPNYFEDNLNEISSMSIEYKNKYDGYFSSNSYLLLRDIKRNRCTGYIPEKTIYKAFGCM